MYQAGYIEKYGTGTGEIFKLCRKAKLKEPEFDLTGDWKKARRIVVIKQSEEIRPKATGKKLKTLFSSLGIADDKIYNTRYHAFVTDQSLPATEIWSQYKRRGDAENRIKELRISVSEISPFRGVCKLTNFQL